MTMHRVVTYLDDENSYRKLLCLLLDEENNDFISTGILEDRCIREGLIEG